MVSALFDDGTRGATISDCGRWRYDLWRRWAAGPLMGWVMLNPSIADGDIDDKTTRKCMRFAHREGLAGITIRNLFAYRTPKPRVLLEAMIAGVDVVGPDNDHWLTQLAEDRFGVRTIVAAWGSTPVPAARIAYVEHLFGNRLHRLAPNYDGAPQVATPHPLYLREHPDDTPIAPYQTRSST